MAHPFGGHPTLKRMVDWLTEQGCESSLLVLTTKRGRSYRALQIMNPKGGRVVIAEPDFDEHLAPSMVAYFQRRLGIKTPFAAMPEMTTDESEDSA